MSGHLVLPGRAGARATRTRVAAVMVMVLAVFGLVVLRAGSPAFADVLTSQGDPLRTGWDQAEPGLSPAAVAGSNFGQLFATQLTGQVYAQPLIIGNTVVVGTEDDWVYALDAVTGAIKWSDNFGPAWPASTIGCGDLTPNLGNTSTGVYDPATNTVYLTTKVNNGPDALHPNWYLHAVDAASGAERAGWPTKIIGTPANDPTHPFSPYDVNQRPGLLLLGGVVYMAFGSQCDYGTYVGLVAGVNTTTRAINMWSDEVGTTSSRAGIWQGGGGLVSDGPGRIFLSTGNGVTAPNVPGTTPPQQLSQSVVRLGVDANGVISTKDFFSPANAASLDTADQDLGSGGPVALPSSYFGTAAVPNLMVEVGKEGKVFLLNRDNLGGKAQGPGGTDAVVQSLGPYRGQWGHPAVYGGDGGYVYYTQNGGGVLAFKYGVDGQGRPALSLAGNTSETFAFSSGSPLVTSDGVKAGTAVVWVVNVDGPSGANARLCAYNAVPVNSHLNLLRCFPIGTGVKFTMPSSSAGRVYVGTRDGRLYGFGQPVTAALNLPQTGFGNVPVGQLGSATVTATAVRTVTINSLSTTAPFSVTAAPALPLTLTAGQTVKVGVSFAPTAPGSIPGTLNFGVTDAGVTGSLGAALQGTATRPGFTGSPTALDFGDVPVGSSVALSVSFANTGTANETVSSVSGPAAAFTATGLPAVGTVVAPGQSVNVSVRFTPTAAGAATSAISVTGPDGTGTVGLTARGVTGQAQLDISPSGLNFGTIPVGLTATETFTVSNSGNLSVTITKAAPPALPFLVTTPLPEGQVLTPGESVQIEVTFAPTAAGTFSGTYLISSTDGTGSHTVTLTGTAVNPSGGQPLPAVGAGSWVFNGTAALVGSDVVLTTATKSQSGSAVFSTPVPSNGLRAAFTTQIGGGTGADGMTFALFDAATVSAQSLGQGGGGLGFAGLAGVAVTFDTYKNGVDPSANFIGLTTGLANGALSYVATATNIPNLRSGNHAVVVTVTGTTVTVSIDGTQVIAATVAGLPSSVRPAFTASTGGMTDRHAVSGVSITSGGTSLSSPGAGWRFNGYASMSGSSVILTPAQKLVAGSVLFSNPVATDGLTASFTLSIDGGTGADGQTFVLLDPATSTSASLGATGGGLGVAGLGGVAVAFVTYPQNGINSNNFAMIGTTKAGGTGLTVVASNTKLPSLRGTKRSVVVKVTGTVVTVALDGVQILGATVPSLTPTAFVGYTAATGGSTDVHAVSAAQVLTGGTGSGGPGTGGAGSIPAPPAAGWVDNGSAVTNGGTITLTPAVTSKAGTAIWSTPVATANLDASFTVTLGGGTGADGLTFMLLDPARTSPTSVGLGGGGLGFQNLAGVAVCFITYAHTGYPSNNFVGVTTGATDANGNLTFADTSTNVPPLRTGTHTVRISAAAAGGLVIAVDGVVVLQSSVALPPTALIGFSAATGGLTDVHAVSGIGISY